MATAESGVSQIGATAGAVWHLLHKKGPLSMAKLVKGVGGPRDTVMQAIGWLAREGKITIDDQGKSRVIGLS